MSDKRLSEDDVVAELESGMTIGIGGWGSRRKPMSIIRAILRSDLTDLTVVSYAGPDLGLLCAAGKVRRRAAAPGKMRAQASITARRHGLRCRSRRRSGPPRLAK